MEGDLGKSSGAGGRSAGGELFSGLVQRIDKRCVGVLHGDARIAGIFDRKHTGDILPRSIEPARQGVQQGGFAGLPGCMQQEVVLLPNELQNARDTGPAAGPRYSDPRGYTNRWC